MDHLEAVRSHTTEKYVLGELRDRAREEFENHFFECEVCAEAVRTGVLFMDNAAAELQTDPARAAAPSAIKRQTSWKNWFTLSWVQPAFAISALALVAQSALWLTDHARLQNELAAAKSPQAFGDVPLDVSRGSNAAIVSRQDRFFAVSFYIDPDTLPEYAIEISGDGMGTTTVETPHNLKGRYNVLLPSARYKSGRYQVTVKGGRGTDGHFVQQFPLYLK